ncbi:Uncharacterised protein [Legionella pneumophila]|nr:Uncharacterised protein [Legionella pneumophila]CZI52286.1 Uncharacterised protein [Legionella pneumophila]CZI58953.1 Uncharacterised protein [Legionella pneumophila]CZM40573.1 Uncharacterised protein [Legionella pneumophila]CZM73655.1 Uncharacterised protein [Legionella pneumophila]
MTGHITNPTGNTTGQAVFIHHAGQFVGTGNWRVVVHGNHKPIGSGRHRIPIAVCCPNDRAQIDGDVVFIRPSRVIELRQQGEAVIAVGIECEGKDLRAARRRRQRVARHRISQSHAARA